MARKPTWKEMFIADGRIFHGLEALWQSNDTAFGPDAYMFFEDGSGFVVTNLSERNLRDLARMDGLRLPERITADPEMVAEYLAGGCR